MITTARDYLADFWHRFGWRRFWLLVITTHLFTSVGTMAAMAADGGHIETTGFGVLIPMPDMENGGQKTLFENYDPAQWVIPSELTAPLDVHLIVMHYLVQLIWLLNILIGYGAVGLSWWLFSFTDIPELSDAVSNLIGGGATELMQWLFPSALAIGALVAYIDMKNGSALNQLLWIFISSVLGLSFALAPNLWVNGVDNARTIGGDAVMSATASQITVDNSYPFDWPEMGASKNDQEELLRKSGDATWRALVVTPWCLTSFGSIEACERYGKDMLKQKSDEERSDYIKDTVYDKEKDDEYSNGKDSPTSQWTKGNQPHNRLPIVIMALVVTAVFSILLIVLGFASMGALIASLLLLAVGVFFALTWCIPGRPRRWGTAWFEQLVGAVFVGIIVTMVFGATLVLETATFAATATRGWGPTLGIALVVICTAFTFRRTLTSIFSMGAAAGGGGLGIAGYLALRGLGTAMKKVGGGKGRGGSPRRPPAPRPQAANADDGVMGSPNSVVRLHRKPSRSATSSRRPVPAHRDAGSTAASHEASAAETSNSATRRPGTPQRTQRSRRPAAGGRTSRLRQPHTTSTARRPSQPAPRPAIRADLPEERSETTATAPGPHRTRRARRMAERAPAPASRRSTYLESGQAPRPHRSTQRERMRTTARKRTARPRRALRDA